MPLLFRFVYVFWCPYYSGYFYLTTLCSVNTSLIEMHATNENMLFLLTWSWRPFTPYQECLCSVYSLQEKTKEQQQKWNYYWKLSSYAGIEGTKTYMLIGFYSGDGPWHPYMPKWWMIIQVATILQITILCMLSFLCQEVWDILMRLQYDVNIIIIYLTHYFKFINLKQASLLFSCVFQLEACPSFI